MYKQIKNNLKSLDKGNVFLFTCIVFAIFVFGFFSFKGSPSKSFALSPEKIVTLTKNGFVPSRLVVKEGDTVTFQSSLASEFWPASGPHPSHEIYPDFDPRQPIQPGRSWSLTFKRPGIWSYHNHLASDQEGEIVVLDYKGGVVDTTCADESLPTVECFQSKVVSTLKKKGLEKALDTMSELYDNEPAFRGSCHAISHTLGKSAYQLFEKGENIPLSGKTSYCSYGFYHGFMEEMLQMSGNFEQAREFCAAAGRTLLTESSNAEGACYHGIGHGVVDGSDPRDWGDPVAMISPGLDICDKVDPTEPHFYRCASGAFNSLALMYIGNEYDLKLGGGDPFAVCNNWKDFRIANPCYQEMNTLVMKLSGGDLAKGIKLVEVIPDLKYAKLAMKSMSGVRPSYFIPPFTDDFKQTIDECHAAKKDLVTSCIQGIPSGIMEFGTPGKEYIPAIEFCSSKLLTDEEALECMKVVFGGVRVYYSKDKQASICATVEEKYKSYCLRP